MNSHVYRILKPVLAILGLILLLSPARPVAQSGISVIMTGLDNPRGLRFGPEGGLYVTEAGQGGTGPCIVLRGQLYCYGPTGAVTRFWRGNQERIATGLPSLARAGTGDEATGPQRISLLGRGSAYVTIGLGMDPARRSELGPAGAQFGQLIHLSASGNWKNLVDIAAYEAAANPDGFLIDSNPFAILAEAGSRIVTDAGGNALLSVAANGRISLLGTFPSRPGRPTDSVPTSVVRGPDGALYVGELTGVPFAPASARIYRVVPGSAPTVFLEGFTTVMDLAFGDDGTLYVLQLATGPFLSGPGALIRVNADGTRTVLASAGLQHPTSMTIGPDGAFYVTNRGDHANVGEVLRIVP